MRPIFRLAALLGLSTIMGASCTGEPPNDDLPAPPSYAPADIPDKEYKAYGDNSPYRVGWWDTIFPRPYRHPNVKTGLLGSWGKSYTLVTPDDFYTYVGTKLAALNGGDRNVGSTKPHAQWIQDNFTRMLPPAAKVWQEPFQFLGHKANAGASRFGYTTTVKGKAQVRTPTFEIFDGSAAADCSGKSFVLVDNDVLQKAANGDQAALAKVKAKAEGQIAVVDRHPTFHRSSQARALGLAKACGMVYVSKAGPLIQTGSARTFFEPFVAIPTITISEQSGAALKSEVGAGRAKASVLKVVAAGVPSATGQSVVAWLPGRKGGAASKEPGKHDSVIIGAHFDAFHEGFADNAGGVAMLMAMTRQLGIDYVGNATTTKNIDADNTLSGCVNCPALPAAAVPNRQNNDPAPVVRNLAEDPKKAMPDIYLVAYDGEEIGLFGGYAFMLNHVEELINDRLKLIIHLETPRGRSSGMNDVVGTSAGSLTGSRFLLQATRAMASLDVVYNATANSFVPSGDVYPCAGPYDYSGGAPFWARGNIFDIIRKFGGILPSDLQGLYRAQVPSIATASEPGTYHTTADTVANEYEYTLSSFRPAGTGLSDWRPNWTSIPFKTKALYDVFLAYLDYYASAWPAKTYGAGGVSLSPTLESARLAMRTDADPMGADPPALSCNLAGGNCKVTISVKNAGNTSIDRYDVYLMYSNTQAIKVGFTADDPGNPDAPVFPARDPLFPNVMANQGTATIELKKEKLKGFFGPMANRFSPWLLVIGKGGVKGYTYNGAVAEMVRPLAFKCVMPGEPGCDGKDGGMGGSGGTGGTSSTSGGTSTSTGSTTSGFGGGLGSSGFGSSGFGSSGFGSSGFGSSGFGSSGFGGGFGSSGFGSSGFGSSGFGSSGFGGGFGSSGFGSSGFGSSGFGGGFGSSGFGSSGFGGGFGSSGFGGAPTTSSSGLPGTGGTGGTTSASSSSSGPFDAGVADAALLDASAM